MPGIAAAGPVHTELPETPILLLREGLFALPVDTIAGCHVDVARHLHGDTPLVEIALAAEPVDPGRDASPPDETDEPTALRVRARTPMLLERDGAVWWTSGENGDALGLDESAVRVIASCRLARTSSYVESALAESHSALSLSVLMQAGVLGDSAMPLSQHRRALITNARTRARLTRRFERFPAPSSDPEPSTGPTVFAVWPEGPWREWTPLALAYLIAVARAQGVTANWVVPRSTEQLRLFASTAPPAVWLFSDYVWSAEANRVASAAVKSANAQHLVVHGGPSVPGFAEERAAFFEANPHIDVAVHGEGEATFLEMLNRLDKTARLDVDSPLHHLAGVAGTTVRTADGLVTGPNRDRIADLDSIPSPYLTGIMDEFVACGVSHMVLETYRGCPFGCTFCDWGSSTNTRLRKFSLARVTAELDWAVEAKISQIVLADSNFGMLPRDVELANHVAETHERFGLPAQFHASWAKNPTARFEQIVRRLVDCGVLAGGGLAIQSYDQATLANVERSNIPPERFDRIWRLFRELDLPMGGEFMIGLPGATNDTFRRDLQFCVEHEIYCLVHRTMLLPNNPMNAPAYRARFEIRADQDGFLEQTTSYGRSQLLDMLADYQAVVGADFLGAARIAARYLAQATALREVDIAVQLAELARSERTTYSALWWVLTMMGRFGTPPAGWDRYLAQLDSGARELWPEAIGAGWPAVLQAQRLILPHPSTSYPAHAELGFDVATWFAEARATRLDGRSLQEAPRLEDFGPGSVFVDDPWEVSRALDDLAQPHGTLGWELRSPFMRPGTRKSALIT